MIDAALECLFFCGGKVVASAAVVVASDGRREGGFQLAEELFHLGVLGGGRRGDLDEVAFDDFVAVRRGGCEVVEVRVEVVGEVKPSGRPEMVLLVPVST